MVALAVKYGNGAKRQDLSEWHQVFTAFANQRARLSLRHRKSNSVINKKLRIDIDPFYRLFADADKNGNGHSQACDYNVEKTVAVLVAESQAIKSLDDAAQSLLSTRRGKKTTLRLHILMEALRVKQEVVERYPDEDPDVVIGGRIGTRYIRSGTVLDSYLNSANGVLNLIRQLQDKPELENWIRIKYGKFEIPWDEYFFDLCEEDYARLRRVLIENGQVSGTRTSELRPITLAIQMRRGFPPKETEYGEWALIARAQRFQETREEGGYFSIQPVLYFTDKELALKVSQARYVIACGLPRVSKREPAPEPKLSPYSQVRMKIFSPTQLCRYSPMLDH